MRPKFIFFISLTALLGITACNNKEKTEETLKHDSTLTSLTQSLSTDTTHTVIYPVGDSTDIYGTGNFDYHDSLETYHRGYSIPRDSIYKVWNVKAFEKLDYLIRKYPVRPGPYLDRG